MSDSSSHILNGNRMNGNDANEDLGDTSDRDPVEELAAEFAERFRNGDDVSIEDYAQRYPKLADDIRDLFPTIAAMERLSTKRVIDAAMQDRSKPKQLGDFRIIEEIARGGMGIVYEAEQVSLDRRVAVKILPSHAFSREKDVQRFYREAKTAASLHHSNIVPVFGVGEEKGQHYIVMQLIRGVGLDEVLSEIKRVFVEGSSTDSASTSEARFNAIARSAANLVDSNLHVQSKHAQSTRVQANADTADIPDESAQMAKRLIKPTELRASLGRDYFRNVARIGLQAAKALDYAHAHETLHRDIKPGNLILDENGRVWVADFGLAKIVADNDVTRSGDVVGTIAYVAPERFEGKTGKASDIYSLGVTLHEMLTLQKAFTGENRVEILNQVTKEGITRPSRINRTVPRDLETIVVKAAASNPADRYSSAGALARDLEAYLEDRPIEARRLSYLEHGVRWCRRNRLTTAMACGIVLLIGSVIGLLASRYFHSEQQRKQEVSQRLQAERKADYAIDFIDGVYDHFAPTLADSALAETTSEEDLADELGNAEPREATPISKDTAIMLENLLDFYDNFAEDSANTDQVVIKRISANRRVGDLHRRLDQLQDAKSSYKEAIRRIDALPQNLRQTVAMRIETARVYNGFGMAAAPFGGGDAHRNARDVLSETGSREERFELATTLFLLHPAEARERHHSRRRGRDRRNRQESRENSHSLEQAQKILTKLLEESPEQVDYELLLAKCLLTERESSTSSDREQGVTILERLVDKHPDRPDFQYELGDVYRKEHRYLARSRERPSESQLFESSAELRDVLDKTVDLEIKHPNIPNYYQLKKELNEFLARVLRYQGEFAEADARFEKATQMQRLLIAHAGSPDRHRPWLYYLHVAHGQTLLEAEKLDRAQELLTIAAEKIEEMMEEDSTKDRRRRSFNNSFNQSHLESAYGSLVALSEKLGNEEATSKWRKKLGSVRR